MARVVCLVVLAAVVAAVAGAEGSATFGRAFVPFVAGGSRPAGECEPSYPTVCLPPPPPDLDCSEIPYTDFAAVPPDAHHLDADEDGIACESSAGIAPALHSVYIHIHASDHLRA